MPAGFNVTEEIHAKIRNLNDIASYAYDAVILAGIAACRASSLSGHGLKKELLKGDFIGVSGRVLVDESIGSRTHETSTIVLNQIRSKSGHMHFEDAIYLWGRSNADADPVWTKQRDDADLDFIDFGSIPPPSVVLEKEERNMIGPMKVLGKVLFGINAFLSCFFILWTYFNRDRVIIRYAQPMFLILIAVGCVVSSATILYLGVEDDDSSQRGGRGMHERTRALQPWIHSYVCAALYETAENSHNIYQR